MPYKLRQAYWRGNEGWFRDVDIQADGTVIGSPPAWKYIGTPDNPVDQNQEPLPGKGKMLCQNNWLTPDGKTLRQAYWRGDQQTGKQEGYYRNVEIDSNGYPNFSKATDWSKLNSPNQAGLSGSGLMETQNAVVLTVQ
ncbi:MAG: hypothetical protein F6K56_07220 [Moorea sp. SIO3G5]|nr:hypothetical protein [Moorena sp. SIO3G5]